MKRSSGPCNLDPMNRNPSRRSFCETAVRALAIAAGAGYAWAANEIAPEVPPEAAPEVSPEVAIDRLRRSCSVWAGVRGRAYRADVAVALMGVTVFSRQGVGSAATLIRESAANGRKTVSLSFAGGSDPKRTRGLNYSGATEEIAVESNSALVEAASFGYVTATSQEESFEQARSRVMDGKGYAHGAFVVVDELHSPSSVRIRRTLIPAPDMNRSDFPLLTREVRSQFAGAGPAEREIPDSSVSATFLYSVLAAAQSSEPRFRGTYLHAGKRYQLECEKSADPHTGAALAAKNLVSSAANLLRLTGQIHDFETRRNSNFRLWLENGSDLPLRIEFAPRAYLRITLDYDPALENTLASKEEA